MSTTVADLALVTAWARRAGPDATALALRQLDELVAVVEQRSALELGEVLAVMESSGGERSGIAPAQRALLALLTALRSALVRLAEPDPAADGGA